MIPRCLIAIPLIGLLAAAGCERGGDAAPREDAGSPQDTRTGRLVPNQPSGAATPASSADGLAVAKGGIVDPQADDALFHEARSLHSDGRWDEAEPKYRTFLEEHPNHVEAHNNFARGLMREGRPAEAIEAFDTVLRLDPSKYSAHRWLAHCYGEVGRAADAERAMRDYEVGRAATLQTAGRWAEVEPVYRKVLEADPGHVDAHAMLAHGLMADARHDEAIPHLLSMLRTDPERNEARHLLAQCYRATGDDTAAETQEREYLFGQAWALHSAGRWSEAKRLYRRLLNHHPDHVQGRFNYAHGLMKNGEPEAAIDEFLDVLDRDPTRNAAHSWLAECYRAIGDETSAERHAALYVAGRNRGS